MERRRPGSAGRLCKSLLRAGSTLAPLLLGILSCGPSREAAFDPTRAQVEARIGRQLAWREERALQGDVENAVKALLSKELTPDAAAQIALLNNRALQARFEDIGIARADLVQATLLVNPSISAEVLFPVTAPDFQGGVGVSFDFLSSVLRPAERELARAQLGVTQLDVAGAAIDLTFAARAGLLDVAGKRQGVAALETFVEAAALSYEVAKRLYAAGNITDLAVLREREQLASARAELAVWRGELIGARRALQVALGVVDDAELRLPRALPPLPEPEPRLATLEVSALEQSIELEVTRRRVDVAERALGMTSARRYLPALSVGANAEQDDGLRAGPAIGVTLPLFDQGQGRVAAREAELRRLAEAYAGAAIDLRTEARRVQEQLQVARTRALVLRDEVLPLRRQILEQAVLQYNAMSIGVFELLLTKRMQLEAEVRWAEAARSYWMLLLAAEQLLAGRMPSFAPRGTRGASPATEELGIESIGLAGDH